MDKKTPLYDLHLELGGKMVSFGGYLLPIQYKLGIIKEHNYVRNDVGLFDVSHMGEFIVEGDDALANINHLLSNDFTSLKPNQIRYGILCNENGGSIDDLLVYCLNTNKYMLVVNAGNIEKDKTWITDNLFGQVTFRDMSEETGLLALQGPRSIDVLSKYVNNLPDKPYRFINTSINGINCLISSTGYTGEDGYEIYTDDYNLTTLFKELLSNEVVHVEPCGLGCRDTLRMEAGLPLYNHELDLDITPIEAGLNRFVKLDKTDFIGKNVLLSPPTRTLVGLQLIERGIGREGSPVLIDNMKVGYVTSGTMSPTLGVSIMMALVDINSSTNEIFDVEVRGKLIKAKKVKIPFYRKKEKNI